jgi:hypothetical protein
MSSDARSHSQPARGRALLVVGAVAALTGVGLVAFAFRGTGGAEAVLEVETVVAATTPDTVPPLAATTVTTTAPALSERAVAPPETTTAAPTTTVPLSPLAALVGERGSAIPEDVTPRVRPTGLTIDELDLIGDVRAVGLRPDGALEVPEATEIGWYRYGAAPGYAGATVLAAHVSWNGDLGPFLKLGELEPGARVEVALEDGTERVYEVTERTMYDKDALPRERIWRNTGPETLVLITCGGDFNPEIRRYRQNIVVYAVPVA